MRFLVLLSFGFGHAPAPDRWTGADKWKHLVVSSLVHGATYSVVRAAGVGHDAAQGVAVPVALGVGLAKELRDRRPGGSGFSGRDLVWDVAGVGLSAAGAHQVR
jgi:putative lipoprotein